MHEDDVATIRRGIAGATQDFHTLRGFYSGASEIELFDDFLSLSNLKPTVLEGRAWKRTICKEVHRLEGILEATDSHTRQLQR